jgi:release factor glutamine methyltransferase
MAEAVARLTEAGCDTPRLDAELLLADAFGIERVDLYTRDTEQEQPPPDAFAEMVRRRAAREPVAYITGRRAFRNIELAVDPRVLIPRPDTETLVEVALERLASGARVHDVGTGSGAIALALKDERPDLVVSGSDVSSDAVSVARGNAERLGLDVRFDVAEGLPPGAYDLVVANLPYVREDEWDGLAPEIRLFEPRDALVSGADGLDGIRDLVSAAPPGTRLALEHGPDQGPAVRALLRDSSTVPDLAGRERVTMGVAG